MRFSENMFIKNLQLETVDNKTISIPDQEHLVHMQFRRFAGCPVCNLHLRAFLKRRAELEQNNIREVIFFHSYKNDLIRYVSDFPFEMVADPYKMLYIEFGVESSFLSLLHPKALLTITRSVFFRLYQVIIHRKKMPPLIPHGGSRGLPADFLVDRNGKILAAKYGVHADDQWSVDQLLTIAKMYNKQ
jgi:peroxiredoxin